MHYNEHKPTNEFLDSLASNVDIQVTPELLSLCH